MNVLNEDKLSKLQQHLSVIRKVAGWTAEDLGKLIGVTRQTISNLEKSTTTTMSKTQYIAIRAVLDYEIESSKNDTLRRVVQILVDKEDIPPEVVHKITNTVESVSFLNRKNGQVAIITGITALLAALGYAAGGFGGAAIFAMKAPKWLSEIIGTDNKKTEKEGRK